MKRLSQLICMFLVASMLLAIPAQAATRGSDYFAAHSCYLWRVSDSEFEVCFDVTAVDIMDKLGASEIKVQRSANGVSWETVATYNDFYGTNRSYYSDEQSFTSVKPGYYYRAKVTFYAEKGNGIAKYTDYTSSLRY